MKKMYAAVFVFLFLILSSSLFAQVATSSWGFGFGGTYPRLTSYNQAIWPANENYGGYLTIQRNFSEHTSIRLKGGYNHVATEYGVGLGMDGSTDIISGDFDFLYTFMPCETLSPYVLGGIGGIYYMLNDAPDPSLDDEIDYEVNLGLGLDMKVGENWSLNTELAIHQVPNTAIDGMYGSNSGGFWGSNVDAYMTFNIGAMYTFGKGEPSRICDLYDGLVADVPEIDYERIENIVKKHIPEVIEKQVVVEKAAETTKWVLVGVNFDFNKATLRPEAYPILFNAVQVLQTNPDMKVEIQGHTDSIASEEYNMKLGQQRAQTVYDYLVSHGVASSRLSTKSYGETQPVADNATAAGRQINRRVEFKVLN